MQEMMQEMRTAYFNAPPWACKTRSDINYMAVLVKHDEALL